MCVPTEDMMLEDDLADLMPAIMEANQISQDLDMKKTFETCVTTAESRGELKGRRQVCAVIVFI